jgi:hypothetical protein
VRYLCGQELGALAQQMELFAQEQDQKALNNAATQFMIKMELLSDEITAWLAQLD